MTLRTQKKSLADKINSLVTTTPITFNSDDEAEDTKAKVVDYYDESDNSDGNFNVSEIRKRNIDTLDQIDERYKGKKISRKDVYESNDKTHYNVQNKTESDKDEELESMEEDSDDEIDDSDEEGSIDANDDDSNIEYDESEKSMELGEEDETDNSNEEEYSEDEDDGSAIEGEGEDPSDALGEIGIQTVSQTNVRDDIEKGNCVRGQLKLWESLLEMRIKFQKCLAASNRMPQHDVYKDFKTDTEYAKTIDEAKSKLKTLLNNMLQLQRLLLNQYPETKGLSTNSRKRKADESIDTTETKAEDSMDEEIPSDTEEENENNDESTEDNGQDFKENTFSKKCKLHNYEKMLADNHNSYIDYRNSVIHKWNEKTRIASGKVNKGANETTIRQIEFALGDKDKLRKRSRLKRSEYKIIGKTETGDDNEGRRVQEYDSEIYDDDDFYHQLLRDLIEYKSSDITDPIQLSKQWIQLQNMRNKMKRKIDTRATKGRRIRFNVHQKLVNFMAPITVDDLWTDVAKDELYNSLFGKIKAASANAAR